MTTLPRLDADRFRYLLLSLGACTRALDLTRGKSLAEAWSTTERPDYMLWLLDRMVGRPGWPARREIVPVVCSFAETVLPLCGSEDRAVGETAVAATRRWARGEATLKEVKNAADAARGSADDAVRAAADAACTAAFDAIGTYNASGTIHAAARASAHAASDGITTFYYAAYATRLREYANTLRAAIACAPEGEVMKTSRTKGAAIRLELPIEIGNVVGLLDQLLRSLPEDAEDEMLEMLGRRLTMEQLDRLRDLVLP